MAWEPVYKVEPYEDGSVVVTTGAYVTFDNDTMTWDIALTCDQVDKLIEARMALRP